MLDDAARTAVEQAIASRKDLAGPLIPILHGIQDALGYVPDDAVPMVASALNISRADVEGVISFYHYFRRHRPGRHVIHLCRAEACQSMNCRALEAHAKASLNVGFHETTADGAFTLEPVYCLGNCALSPAMMIDGELYGRVSPERFETVTAAWRQK